ncbi:MAG TPA: phenylalanine--tRNA ligase subunit beta, partial [Bacteroidia bacterium]|nr:phenylalanine--tRNA ligase subunit beta [Bacteroidia bacterium]
MKISYNWLKDFIKTELSAEEIASLLTNCGLEVESIDTFESIPGGLKGLVVGEVVEKTKHPNADKLSLTKVNIGTGNLLSIVCGASNVAVGQKVVVAPAGTTVFPVNGEPFEIKKSKIRGELSEGMICAEDEIGLGGSHEGILVLDNSAKIGTSAAEYFNLHSDFIFEIGLTPNRADAVSHYGVARDLAAVILASELKQNPDSEHRPPGFPPVSAIEESTAHPITVEIKNPEACIRYSGIYINNLTVKESPGWMQERLQAIGVRPINNIVDVTNYVMHELGQPLHAFDADRIEGKKVVVRKVSAGTKFITLDNIERKLSADDLMICDTVKPMCIAGVFGGIDSGVSEKTMNIFLESAFFDPVHVRKTGKRHQLKTESSFRFERGTDPEMTVTALQRAIYLLEEVAGAQVSGELIDIYPEKVEEKEIAFTYAQCDLLTGKSIPHTEIKKILLALGIEIESEGKDALRLLVPAFKVDVTGAADVIEEVLRIYGYNNIPLPEFLRANLSISPKPDPEKIREHVSGHLSSNGFCEILNNSLTKA